MVGGSAAIRSRSHPPPKSTPLGFRVLLPPSLPPSHGGKYHAGGHRLRASATVGGVALLRQAWRQGQGLLRKRAAPAELRSCAKRGVRREFLRESFGFLRSAIVQSPRGYGRRQGVAAQRSPRASRPSARSAPDRKNCARCSRIALGAPEPLLRAPGARPGVPGRARARRVRRVGRIALGGPELRWGRQDHCCALL